MDKELTIGCDPCNTGSAPSAFTFITIDEAVKSYLKHRPIINYQAEALRIAQYYGAGVLVETSDDCFFDEKALNKRLEELHTEDAEVISIETVLPQK